MELRCPISRGLPIPNFMFFRNGVPLNDSANDITITRVSVVEGSRYYTVACLEF